MTEIEEKDRFWKKQKAKEDVFTILLMMAYVTLVQVFRPMTLLLEKS